jgi:PAS domain S-box-containing protein
MILTGNKHQSLPNEDEIKAFSGIVANALGRKKAEEMLNISQSALKNSEFQYRNLFESVPVGLTKTTVDGTLLDFNITALKLLGYNHRDEIVGKNADDFWAFREQRKLLIPKKLEDGTFEFDFQLRRKDNSLIWVRCKSKAVRDSNNISIHLENSMEDITERKKAEELLVKNEALLKKAQEISHFGHFRYTQTEGISDQSNEFLNILE